MKIEDLKFNLRYINNLSERAREVVADTAIVKIEAMESMAESAETMADAILALVVKLNNSDSPDITPEVVRLERVRDVFCSIRESASNKDPKPTKLIVHKGGAL